MPKKTVKTLKRSQTIDPTPVEGNLVKPIKTKFISLVGHPANQTGFKVVRSDQGESEMAKPTSRRLRRSETNPVLRLTFPEGTNEADVQQTLSDYGMASYVVRSDDKGIFTATRADLQSIANEGTAQIKLTAGGIVATVTRAEQPAPQTGEKSQVAVVGFEFDPDKFDSQQASAWLQRNSVDKCGTPAQNSDETALVVLRGDGAADEEVRRVQVEEGVTAVICRADAMSIPDGMVAVVSEIAYGSWGWGQLDFNAAMADVAFCEQMDEAVYRLRSVLQDILFYSPLPIDVRKQLVKNSLDQFGAYVENVMDSLPRQVLVSVVRSDAQPKQEKEMTKQTTNEPGAGAETKPEAQTITREELATAIAAGIKAHEEAKAAEVQRAAEEKAKADADEAAAKEASDKQAELQRSAVAEAVKEAIAPLNEEIAKLKGATIVRSGSGDATVTTAKPEKKDVFRGAFGNLRRAGRDAAAAAAADDTQTPATGEEGKTE